jgi:uncharacterized glyoxalase superfamily metalloenzyme YdcJ
MRKLVFVVSLLISTLAFGQDIEVPDLVISTFEERFPDAEQVKWEKLKTNFQATFEDIETTMAQFTPEGKWVKTAVIVTEDELPVIAAEHIEENFEDAEITQVQMVENSKEEITYLVVMVVGDKKIKIKFNDEGVVIEK